MEVRRDRRVEDHAVVFQLLHVPEGFVHDEDDVGLGDLPVPRLGVAALKLRGEVLVVCLFHQLFHGLFGVVLGLVHLKVLDIGQ